MECTRCQAENPPTARFCMQCGAALPVPCPHCGAALPPNAKFCMQCGQPLHAEAAQVDELPTSGERRIATVVLADVKGSTALAERIDTETWVEIMRGVFQVLDVEIYRYGGQIDQYRGDGLVAFFGVPTAHEDDAERAVLAALAMQEAIRRYAVKLQEQVDASGAPIELQLRVGVNTGEVVVASVGDQRWHSEDTAMGRAVALAARMETAAAPGTVLVTEHTYRLVAPLFEWEALGEIAVKGIREPVAVYRPLAHRPAAGKGRGIPGLESPLVGRDAELSALQGAVERLRAGVGGIVTLVGEAGLGKSRLIAELRKVTVGARRAQMGSGDVAIQWAEGRCLSYAGGVAYSLWLDLLPGLLGAAPDAGPLTLRDALHEWARAFCADCLDDVYPYLGRMLSLPLEEHAQDLLCGLQAEGLREKTFRAAETLLVREAGRGPLILICEDLHWADPTSLALLERILTLPDRIPLLLICVLRPETGHGCWQIRETAARAYRHRHLDLWLGPLSRDEGAALVGNLLRVEDLPTALRERVLAYGEGNPFYVEEILRSLIDRQAIAYDEGAGRWHATQDAVEIAIPGTLHGVLADRIDRLPEEARRVLQVAAVIGRIFPERVLAAVTPVSSLPEGAGSQVSLEAQLLILQRAQLIRERARLPEREYAFKHYLTHEAAYASLLRRERRACHRQAAEALERLYPERIEQQLGALAHHWERAGYVQKASAYLHRAAEQAAAQFANAEAVAYLSRALELVDEDDLAERYRLLRAREGVLDLQGAREAQRDDLDALDALASALADPTRQADVALVQAHYAARTQDYDAAAAAARRAVGYAQDAQDAARQAAAHREVGRALRYLLEDEPAWKELERALLLARAAGVRQVEADTLHELGALSWESASSDDSWAEQLHICREIGDRQREGRALRDLGLLQRARGQYTKAIASFEESLRVCQATGNWRDEGWALHCLGLVYGELGDSASARTYAERAAAIHWATGDHLGMAWVHWILARACTQEGDHAGAREQLAQMPEGQLEARRLCLSADVSWSQGDVDRAKREYEETLRLTGAASSERPEKAALCGLAAIALVEGNAIEAQRYTARLLTDLGERPRPRVFRPHLVCYRVLRANGDPRADGILEQAYRMLQERAGKIEEETLRRSYLENVAAHREIATAWQSAHR